MTRDLEITLLATGVFALVVFTLHRCAAGADLPPEEILRAVAAGVRRVAGNF